MIPRFIIYIIFFIYGVILPIYWSHKAIRSRNINEINKWLIHWVIFSMYMQILSFSNVLLGWFPFYNEIILFVFLWLISSSLKGSEVTYQFYLGPFLSKYEYVIDTNLAAALIELMDTGLKLTSQTLKYVAGVAAQVFRDINLKTLYDTQGNIFSNLWNNIMPENSIETSITKKDVSNKSKLPKNKKSSKRSKLSNTIDSPEFYVNLNKFEESQNFSEPSNFTHLANSDNTKKSENICFMDKSTSTDNNNLLKKKTKDVQIYTDTICNVPSTSEDLISRDKTSQTIPNSTKKPRRKCKNKTNKLEI